MSVESLIAKHGKTVTVKTRTTANDAVGSPVETWTSVVGVYTAMVQISGGSDATTAGREGRQRTATMYLVDDQDQKIDIEDRIDYGGAEWEIRSVRVPDERQATDQLCYTIVDVEEVIQ